MSTTSYRSGTGQRLAGRYELDRVVGHGGMGTVWAAADHLLGREVAVKQILGRGGLQNGVQEAQLAARIVSPHVARVYDLVVEDDTAWIVMQLLPTRTLADVFATGGPLAPRAAARIALDVLAALDATHRAGVVHRDVKPSNVMVADDGHAVLVDFGLATSVDDHSSTSPAPLLGSPAYLPPERAQGRPSGPAGDIWSLGAMLFAAIQGAAPYQREDTAATVDALLLEPAPAADRAAGLAALIALMLARNPRERPTVDEARRVLLLSLLRDLDGGPPARATPGDEAAGGDAPDPGAVSSARSARVGDGGPDEASWQDRGVRHAAAPARRSARRSRSSWRSTRG